MIESSHLRAGLKQRHLTMITIGGVIGAGLFVGSGVVFPRLVRRPSSAMGWPACSSSW